MILPASSCLHDLACIILPASRTSELLSWWFGKPSAAFAAVFHGTVAL
jgi:hypothetical protein